VLAGVAAIPNVCPLAVLMRVDDEDGRYRREECEVVETTYAAFTYTT
jgi:hypothetical protein